MTNMVAAVTGIEYGAVDIGVGFQFPTVQFKYGYSFGWAGSASRYTGAIPALGVRYNWIEELLTVAAAATSDTAANLLLANSVNGLILGRVTVAIPTAATFTVGDATQAARFASGVAVAANTTFVGFLHWNPAVASDNLGPRQTADAKIRVTPNLTPGNANGRLALQSWSWTGIPPTA